MISQRAWRVLQRRMEALGVREADLEERFTRSGGPGGRNVDRTATCVVLRHRPSGTLVHCRIARSQADNRFYARRILCDKLEQAILGRQSAQERERHRIRAQKRRRSRRARAKMLESKRRRSEQRMLRQPPAGEPEG